MVTVHKNEDFEVQDNGGELLVVLRQAPSVVLRLSREGCHGVAVRSTENLLTPFSKNGKPCFVVEPNKN